MHSGKISLLPYIPPRTIRSGHNNYSVSKKILAIPVSCTHKVFAKLITNVKEPMHCLKPQILNVCEGKKYNMEAGRFGNHACGTR